MPIKNLKMPFSFSSPKKNKRFFYYTPPWHLVYNQTFQLGKLLANKNLLLIYV
jgi:hypothetical protein